MIHDPIIEEIRRVREDIAKQFGYDAQAYGRFLMREQKKSGHPIVDRRAGKTAPPPRTESRDMSPR